MKIESGNVGQGLVDEARESRVGREGQAASKQSAQETNAGDQVALSDRVRQMKALAAEITNVKAIDTDRVAELRAQVLSGAFTPSSEAIAKALAEEFVGA